MLGWVQPNGVKTAFTYDSVNHLQSDTITNAASTVLASYTYTLSATGNRTGVTEASGRAITWGYDSLYRLTGETITGSASANGAIGYTYDAVGNRLSRTSSVTGIAASTATYDANDRVSGESFDNNGDQLTRDGRTQSFDSQDRLVSSAAAAAPSVHVYYNGDGNRVAVDVGGALVSYLIDDQNPTGYSQVVEERVGGAVTRAYVFGRKALSKRDLNAGAWIQSYYEQDGHGSVTALTDASGVVTDTYEYDAFGTVIGRTGTTANSLTYSGEWMDADLALQHLRARWYSPGTGRFVSRDLEEGYDTRTDTLHAYVYGSNSPTEYTDPSGRSIFDMWYGIFVEREICTDFMSGDPMNRSCNISFPELLRRPQFGPRPDLVDEESHELYEIGTRLEYPIKRLKMDGLYVPLANKIVGGDPPWHGGTTYRPPETIWILYPMIWADVDKPKSGVITYQVIDMTPAAVALVAATSAFMTELTSFIATSTLELTMTRGF
jgi:RHS repeat-associated protein